MVKLNLFCTGHWWPARPKYQNNNISNTNYVKLLGCHCQQDKNIYKCFDTPDPKISTNVLTRASKQYKQSSQVQEFQR